MNRLYLILGCIAAVPLIFWLGTLYGAKSEKTRIENAQLLSDANNDINTVTAISKVKQEYQPIYHEVTKYVEAPKCDVPAVIADTIDRLPTTRP